MKITMTHTTMGSLDGETVQELVQGEEYETVASGVGDRLAQYHIAQSVAIMTPAEAPEVTPEPVTAPVKARK